MTRVTLSPLAASDREAFVAAMTASHELHHPWLFPPTNDVAFAALLARDVDGRHETHVVKLADGAIAGYFTVGEIVRGALQSAYLAYGGVAGLDGRGYMSEGLGLLLDHIFGAMSLHRAEANIQPANHRSIALVRRAGFSKEGFSPRYLNIAGEWRDHERWALTVEDWRARRTPKRTPKKS
ncbi:MAG TPA: GNAT family protein [Solirubrobacteraceae bacterium]|nr:GNAT family protein [Solirubrobacteraceae bacterium]